MGIPPTNAVSHMDKKRLLDRVNIFAGQRYGIRVTPRRLRDWVSEGLVPGPTSHGNKRGVPPTWDWPQASLDQISQICQLKKNGFNRTNELRIALWMNGADIPIKTLREALATEFCRSRNLALRPINSTLNPRESKPLSDYGRSALLNQMGPVDPRLLPEGFSLSKKTLLDSYAAMRFGEEKNNPVNDFVSELARHCRIPEQETIYFLKYMADFLLMLSGLAGKPDEITNSTENSIKMASAKTFESARAFCQNYAHLLNPVFEKIPEFPPEFQKSITQFMGPLKLISSTVRKKYWQPAWLGMWVHYFHQNDGSEKFPDEIKPLLTDHMSIS